MNRSAFKHGYWAAPRGLQSQEATTISILCPTIDHISFIRDRLVMCNILDVQKGNASLGIIWTYFQSTLGICSAIGKPPMNRIYNRNVFNMATELPPGDCNAKEPQLYPYCFRPKPWCNLLITFLSLENAFCNILDVQKRNASFEHIFDPCWGFVVLLGSHLWKGMLF